ncbi:unnamed protein product [Paramecium sonneborni]|uniref:Uncharacterized protein n=1 Tax=Paramecium sonneborni TaxID=65129 RepID=A0A8S1NN67_9CILI|nr:unnamed protein product [Paramecium sonneborni]
MKFDEITKALEKDWKYMMRIKMNQIIMQMDLERD